MQVKLAGRLRKDSGSPLEAGSHRIPFTFQVASLGRVVIGPDHGPHVDVEQGTVAYTTGSGDGRYYMRFVPIWPWQ